MKTNITLYTLAKIITWLTLSFIFFHLALVIINAFFTGYHHNDFISLHRTLHPIFSIGNGLSRFLIMVFTVGWFILAGKQFQHLLPRKKRYTRLTIALSVSFLFYYFYLYYNYNYSSDWYSAQVVLGIGMVISYFLFIPLFQIFKSSGSDKKEKDSLYSPFRFKIMTGLWATSHLLSFLAHIREDDYASWIEKGIVYGIKTVVLFLFIFLIQQYSRRASLLSSGQS